MRKKNKKTQYRNSTQQAGSNLSGFSYTRNYSFEHLPKTKLAYGNICINSPQSSLGTYKVSGYRYKGTGYERHFWHSKNNKKTKNTSGTREPEQKILYFLFRFPSLYLLVSIEADYRSESGVNPSPPFFEKLRSTFGETSKKKQGKLVLVCQFTG